MTNKFFSRKMPMRTSEWQIVKEEKQQKEATIIKENEAEKQLTDVEEKKR